MQSLKALEDVKQSVTLQKFAELAEGESIGRLSKEARSLLTCCVFKKNGGSLRGVSAAIWL